MPPKVVLYLARRAQEPEHLLHEKLMSPLSGQLLKIKTRQPFAPAKLELLNNPTLSGISVAHGPNIDRVQSGGRTPLDSIHLLRMLFQRHRELAFEDLHGSS